MQGFYDSDSEESSYGWGENGKCACVFKRDTEHACCVSDLCVKCLVAAAGLDVLLMRC